MAVDMIERKLGKILEVRVEDRLTDTDYQEFVPRFERLVRRHGRIRVLFDMRGFHGWETKALWDDIKLDLKHFADLERIAMIGEKKWQKWMSGFRAPFTTAGIRYFDRAEADEAHTWIEAG